MAARGGHRLDGQRQPAGGSFGQGASRSVQLLQAAVRAGHQSAHRPDPRGDRHVAGVSFIGPKPNLLDINAGEPADAARGGATHPGFCRHGANCATIEPPHCTASSSSYSLDITYPLAWGHEGVEAKLASLCAEAVDAIRGGKNVLIISDRSISATATFAIPALLALSGHPPAPGARGPAHHRRPGCRDRQRPRGAPLCRAGGIWRRGGPSRIWRWRPWPTCYTTLAGASSGC